MNEWMNEWSFRPPLCTYRLNWAWRNARGCADECDDTAPQTQYSEFGLRPSILSISHGGHFPVYVHQKQDVSNSGIRTEIAKVYSQQCHLLSCPCTTRRSLKLKVYWMEDTPADTRHWINVGLTLVQRCRRWTNVKQTLLQRLVSAGTPFQQF